MYWSARAIMHRCNVSRCSSVAASGRWPSGRRGIAAAAYTRDQALKQLEQIDGAADWELAGADDKLHLRHEMRTKNFRKAMALLNDIADVAEELKHHPDLHIEGWNRVRIEIWTHEGGQLTEKDFELARRIGALDLTTYRKQAKGAA